MAPSSALQRWLLALCAAVSLCTWACGERVNPGGNCPILPAQVTYETVKAQVLVTCIGCHSRGQKNRFGAPNDVNFDTYDDAVGQADEINMDILGQRMPPSGGISDPNVRCLFDAWMKNNYAH